MVAGRDEQTGKFAEYIAVAETFGEHPDGSPSDDTRVVLDAIPIRTLDLIESGQEASDRIDFFMLTLLDDPRGANRGWDLDGYLLITVSEQSDGSGNEIRAFPTGLNGIDNNNITYFVSFSKKRPERRHINTLERISQFSNIPDTEDLTPFKPRNYRALAVAVYDVGQGSMSALVNEIEHPVMFFDLGWPLSFCSKSIPATKGDFNPFPAAFAEKRPRVPVVLSHLDLDHWGYAIESGMAQWDDKIGAWKTVPTYRRDALERPWLMQRPKFRRHQLKPSHIHFVQTLSITKIGRKCALHFWPRRLRRATLGPVTLFLCRPAKGTPKTHGFLRNNEAIGMLVEDKKSAARALLAGDADFPSIPSFAKTGLTGLVAPHHGGKITLWSVPNAVGHGRMVMSVYPGSYSNMPHPDVEKASREQGWHIAYTHERKPCFRMGKTTECGNRLIRLSHTPFCGCKEVPNACLCVSETF